jgi:hypothetical protein
MYLFSLLRSTILAFGRHNDEKSQPKQKVVIVSLDLFALFAHRHWQIGRLDKRSIGLDGVRVAANVEFAAAIPLNGL